MRILHQWTIKRFGYFYYAKDNKCKLSFVQSDAFPPESESTFFLRLYPKAIHRGCEDNLSISLHSLQQNDDDSSSQIDYKLAIINRTGKHCNQKGETNVKSSTNEFRQDKFIPRDDLVAFENGYLPNEELTIHCEIEFLKGQTDEFYESKSESNAEVEVTRLEHQWEIKEFDLCRKFAMKNNISVSSSDDLCHLDQIDNKFFLRLWPTGRGTANDHLSIYFYPLSNNQTGTKSAQYKISLVNSDKEKCFTQLNKETIIGGNEFGCRQYIRLSELHETSNKLLADDVLKIYCEVDLVGGEINKTFEQVDKPRLKRLKRSTISNLNTSFNISNSENLFITVASKTDTKDVSMSRIMS